jgi:hypothetical protein
LGFLSFVDTARSVVGREIKRKKIFHLSFEI